MAIDFDGDTPNGEFRILCGGAVRQRQYFVHKPRFRKRGRQVWNNKSLSTKIKLRKMGITALNICLMQKVDAPYPPNRD